MAKKKSKSNQIPAFSRKRILTYTVILLLLAVVIQSLLIVYLFRQSRVHDNARIGQLVIQAVEGLIHDLPQDPKTGTVFISKAGLTLPPVPADLGQVVYSYEEASNDFQPILHLALKNEINRAKSLLLIDEASPEKTFSAVPKLQSCARGVSISYDKKFIQELADSKVLSNGKTVYFSTETLCRNESLLQYAKTVDSY
jgi:hypothetical protein